MNYTDMTDDELRVAVAKRLGYELRHGFMDEACINPKDYWITPEGRLTSILPDYPRDIAAAYELEDALPEEKRGAYAKTLFDVYEHDIVWNLIHASPADRCRAWLLTMDAKP